MLFDQKLKNIINEHKTLFMVLLIGLFLLEMEIFLVAATKAGHKSWLQVTDAKGNVIYKTVRDDIITLNHDKFEKTFGPLKNYHVKQVTEKVPFPFRAWFVAAIGLPVGGMLLLGFVIRSFSAIFTGDRRLKTTRESESLIHNAGSRFEMFVNKISRLNIFVIGFLIFAGIISYWIIPNFFVSAGKIGLETITRYKWFFLSVTAIGIAVFCWIIYLRFLLAKKQIDSQTEIEKVRLQMRYEPKGPRKILPVKPSLTGHSTPPVVEWNKDSIVDLADHR
ncbi:MAG: hypothetical protein K9L30_10950 [Desulfobacterales bacterium]|nr:hypothetical protein [Desulfobacterales bacterium]